MSMTQIAFLRNLELPTKGQIQEQIQKLGYDFQIFDDLERKLGDDGIECSINGHKTYFETYLNVANDLMSEQETKWIEPDLTNQNTAISFVWGADFSAGACIGLISVALIDLSGALIYYIDDQMKYTREMLIEDTPQFLEELNKQLKVKAPEFVNHKHTETNFWTILKRMFK